jgi:hypothetical protein
VLREEPDFDEAGPARAADDAIGSQVGRIVEPGSDDTAGVDDEKDAVATEVVDDDEGALSAEEAAMHITESP